MRTKTHFLHNTAIQWAFQSIKIQTDVLDHVNHSVNPLIPTMNKRPMGHIAHLRKQFKSINTYDYLITLIKRREKPIINFMRIYFLFI